VSGPKGSIPVHVPFTVNDIQQCREMLGRYNEDPDKFTVKFQTLELGFDLTWRDIQFLLANCCTPTKREKILTAAHREADEVFTKDPIVTVPMTEPHWDYNTPGGMQRRAHMFEAILHGMKTGGTKPVNYPESKGKPTAYDRLDETFRKYTTLDPDC
jgi:hypothetical protein